MCWIPVKWNTPYAHAVPSECTPAMQQESLTAECSKGHTMGGSAESWLYRAEFTLQSDGVQEPRCGAFCMR